MPFTGATIEAIMVKRFTHDAPRCSLHRRDTPLTVMQTPVLALFGGRDTQVPAAQSVPILEEVWHRHPDATVRVFPELNHLFQSANTGLPSEYSQIAETFAPAALETVSDWILSRFGR